MEQAIQVIQFLLEDGNKINGIFYFETLKDCLADLPRVFEMLEFEGKKIVTIAAGCMAKAPIPS